MKSKFRSYRFVSIGSANNMTESIRIKMMLDRARIPYRVRNEQIHTIYGMGPINPAFGPLEFEVPQDLYADAIEALDAVFQVNLDDLPEKCPACDAATNPASADCPSCGLFLG